MVVFSLISWATSCIITVTCCPSAILNDPWDQQIPCLPLSAVTYLSTGSHPPCAKSYGPTVSGLPRPYPGARELLPQALWFSWSMSLWLFQLRWMVNVRKKKRGFASLSSYGWGSGACPHMRDFSRTLLGWYRSVWRSGGIETWKMWDWHQEHPGTPGSKRHSCSLILLRSIILVGPTIFLKVMGLCIVNMIVSYCARWSKALLSTMISCECAECCSYQAFKVKTFQEAQTECCFPHCIGP